MSRPRPLRAKARVRAAILALILAPLTFASTPAVAEHSIKIDFTPVHGRVQASALTLRFQVEGECGSPVAATATGGASTYGAGVKVTAKRSCDGIEAKVLYVVGRFTRHQVARETADGWVVTIPREHMREGKRISYRIEATRRWCDTQAAAGVFIGCGPYAGAGPNNCHLAQAQTRNYEIAPAKA